MTDNLEGDQPTDESQDNTDRPMDDVQVRLARVEDVLHRYERPWFHTPSNVISILAVVASIGVFFLTFVSDTQETKFQKLQQLGQVIDQISALATNEADLFRPEVPPNVRTNAMTAYANRRSALVNQVDRLLAEVDAQSVSKLDLALLSVAYAAIGYQDKAEKILLDLAHAESEPLHFRVMAWRSLISLYSRLGSERIPDAVKAAKQGMALIDAGSSNFALKYESVLINNALAFFFMTERRFEEAFTHLLAAKSNAWTMPCGPARRELLTLIQSEIQRILHLQPPDRDALAESRLTYGPPCASDNNAVDVKSSMRNHAADMSADYVGDYNYGHIRTSIRAAPDGGIQAVVGGSPPQILDWIGSDIFSVRGSPGYYLVFRRDDKGAITHAYFHQPNGVFPAARN